MPRLQIDQAALTAAKAERDRAAKRAAKQAAMNPQPSGYAHTLSWLDLAERKVAAIEAGTPDAWRKPRGAAAQRAAGMTGTNGGTVPAES